LFFGKREFFLEKENSFWKKRILFEKREFFLERENFFWKKREFISKTGTQLSSSSFSSSSQFCELFLETNLYFSSEHSHFKLQKN
jgi:hypothetical protein